jgi:succinoglycan biosynthesis transport protein ExoP
MPHPSSPNRGYDDLDRDAADFEAVQPDPGNKMKRLLLQLLGRWYWIALFAILGFLGAFYYLSKAPQQYTAGSTLLVIPKGTSALNPIKFEEVDAGGQAGMNTIAERIRRMDLLEKVASRQDVRDLPGLIPPAVDWTPERLRGKFGIPEPEAASTAVPAPGVLAGQIAGWMQVSIRRFTLLIDITVTHPVPEVSSKIADAIAREYLAEIYQTSSTGRTEMTGVLLEEAKNSSAKLALTNSAYSTYERSLDLHQKLDAEETETNLFKQRYLPKHPKMIAATAEVADIKRRFLESFDVARTAESDKEFWEKAATGLPDPVTQPDTYLTTARQLLLSRVGLLKSEIASTESTYRSILARLDEMGLGEQVPDNTVIVSSFARVPGPPSGPNRDKILATGTMGGLALGLLLALFLGWLDNKFHTVSQLAAETGAGILAAIAQIKPRQLAKAERDYLKRYPQSAETADPADWHDFMLFRPGASATSYAEMFRVLRASVSLLGDETRRKVTVFTSALPGEGKSSISANFALAAASQGKKTLLIDFDLRKPSLHQLFGVDRSPLQGGLTECLANLAPLHEVATPVAGQPNLHLVVSGKRAPNPGELLDTTRIKALLVLACRNYDVVVLDTAPLLSVPDTRILAPLAHNVALVVRAEYTRKAAVARALKVLEEDRTPLSGLVFNAYQEKRRLIGENYSYGYYGNSGGNSYGTYGTYGDDDEDDGSSRASKAKRRKRKQSTR